LICHNSGDDPNYLVNLANTLDAAMAEYDVDARGCLAHVMCKEMGKRDEAVAAAVRRAAGMDNEDNDNDGDDGSSLAAMLGYGAVKMASKWDIFLVI